MVFLMFSAKNLLKMTCVWTTHKLLMFEKRQGATMFDAAMLIIRDFNYLLQHAHQNITPALTRIFTAAVQLAMEYLDFMDRASRLYLQGAVEQVSLDRTATYPLYF